ncbi:MAG: C-GCAxxG-C-C family (seleno)protein [Bacilli bacterium]
MIQEISLKFSQNEYNCAQAMIAYMYQTGLKYGYNNEEIYSRYFRLGKAFGGGITGLKQTCGFLTGFCIGLDLIMEPTNTKYQQLVHYFNEEYIKLTNTTSCKEITSDYDFTSSNRKAHCTSNLDQILQVIDQPLNDFLKEYSNEY